MSDKTLRNIKQELERLKKELDEDVPNHEYDTALFLAAKAGGMEVAIDLINAELKSYS